MAGFATESIASSTCHLPDGCNSGPWDPHLGLEMGLPLRHSWGMTSSHKIVPVIDLFAGPGGLSEGFTRYADWFESDVRFRSVLSIEKDPAAAATLTLRSFYRLFSSSNLPAEYWSVVRDQAPVDVLRRFPEWRLAEDHVWQAELGKIDLAELHGRISSRLGNADEWLLLGGPPCQAYSLVGRARMTGVGHDARQDESIAATTRASRLARFHKDVRHELYREYLRIIAVHQPSVFVMENVKGILSSKVPDAAGTQALMFDRIREDLADPWASLADDKDLAELERLARPGRPKYRLMAFGAPVERSAAPRNKDFLIRSEDYGVPQKRHRVIILGVRDDGNGVPGELERSERTTVRDAIGALPPLRSGLSRNDSDEEWRERRAGILKSKHIETLPKRVKDAINSALLSPTPAAGRGAKFVPASGCIPPQTRLESWLSNPAVHGFIQHESRTHMESDLVRYLFAAAAAAASATERSPKLEEWPHFLLPAHRNVSTDAAGTIKTSGFSDRFKVQVWQDASSTVTSHISKDGHYFIHPDPAQGRSLTVREAARLQTFPDDYFFCGNRTQQYHQVGNAVPPYLAVQLAKAVAPLFWERISGKSRSG